MLQLKVFTYIITSITLPCVTVVDFHQGAACLQFRAGLSKLVS